MTIYRNIMQYIAQKLGLTEPVVHNMASNLVFTKHKCLTKA